VQIALGDEDSYEQPDLFHMGVTSELTTS
jgi:hypothetical protein